MSSLFDQKESRSDSVDSVDLNASRVPLAERLRPKHLSEYIGQKHILAPGKLLRRAIEADKVSSLILYGPPGTGKTTLARVIAEYSNSTFIALNAVLSGVKAIREEVQAAENRLKRFNQSTLLFIDEIHRFNQSQQDALLPWVERGIVTLIGATTENPYFEVNNALNSRSHIFQLQALDEEDLREVLYRALSDPKAYAHRDIELKEEAVQHWISVVNGDARALLNALELAVESSPNQQNLVIDLELAEASIQERAVLYDREGDTHFDTLSAYIKSMRGSDPDAALYWLAKMVYAGEPPRHIFRRLLIFASEDVGLAWSQGLAIVESCAAAFDRVGMPEGRFHLAHATLAMATAPKSNSTLGFFDAYSAVQNEEHSSVPNHLKDANRDGEAFGHGKGYLYPHAYQNHWVAQDYLPKTLQGKLFYQPSNQGDEAQIQLRVKIKREAQLEGMVSNGTQIPFIDIKSASPHESALEKWVERAMGQVSDELAQVRDSLFKQAQLKRSDLVLDLNAGGGLLTWPATRYCLDGGVWSYCQSAKEAEVLSNMAQELPWAHQPTLLYPTEPSNDAYLNQLIQVLKQAKLNEIRFDHIIGRSLFTNPQAWPTVIQALSTLLSNHDLSFKSRKRVTLAEPYLYQAQKLSSLSHLNSVELDTEWQSLEVKLYQQLPNYWQGAELIGSLTSSIDSSISVQTQVLTFKRQMRLSSQKVKSWLNDQPQSYLSQLKQLNASASLIKYIEHALTPYAGRQVNWQVAWLLVDMFDKSSAPVSEKRQ